MDSIVSALVWSYYKQSQTDKDSKMLYIPILTIPKKEFKLRKDALYLFEQIDKSIIDNLFFIDTIHKILAFTTPPSHNNNEEKQIEAFNINLNVHLVDHNNLSISLDPLLGKYVNYIIDHHADEGNYLNQCKDNQRIINFVGSNVSNVINHIQSNHKDFDIAAIGKVFGSMINAVILLDTAAFDEKMKKTTDTDVKVYNLFKDYNLMKDHKAWYDILLEKRCDMDGFTFSELLVKDMKIFKENEIIFGIPGIGTSLQSIVESEKNEMFEVIDAFQREKQLDMVTVGSIYSENNALQRQLALFSDNEVLFNTVSNALETQQNILQPIEIGQYQHKSKFVLRSLKPLYYQWWKVDISVSRKKLVPLLRKILKSSKL